MGQVHEGAQKICITRGKGGSKVDGQRETPLAPRARSIPAVDEGGLANRSYGQGQESEQDEAKKRTSSFRLGK
jgi:hypothetical protein